MSSIPVLKDFLDEDDIFQFQISNVDVCFVNAIRRTILSDIDVCCIEFDSNEEDNKKINITVNTGRLHNEILKHRLSCIPIYIKDDIKSIISTERSKKSKSLVLSPMEKFCEENILEIDCHNDSDTSIFVTTKDFRIKNIISGDYLDSKQYFPPNRLTNDYIDFSRLRGKMCDTIPGESLKLTALFSISNANKNSTHNVVSICSYSNTLDKNKIKTKWNLLETDMKAKGLTEESIVFEKTNFYHLDANRCFIENSFEFKIQSICLLTNREILTLAVYKLCNKFYHFLDFLETDKVTVLLSDSIISFCYDVQLYEEDYTFGKILEYLLYHNYYKSKILSYCGFKKFHPHDTKSVIRLAFTCQPEPKYLEQILNKCCLLAIANIHGILQQII